MTKIIVFLKRPTPVHGKAGFGAREVGFGGLVHGKAGFGAREVGLGALVHGKGGFGARGIGDLIILGLFIKFVLSNKSLRRKSLLFEFNSISQWKFFVISVTRAQGGLRNLF